MVEQHRRIANKFKQACYNVVNAVAPEMEVWDDMDDEDCAAVIVDQMSSHGDMDDDIRAEWDALSYDAKCTIAIGCR
jgi:hypothetical protein